MNYNICTSCDLLQIEQIPNDLPEYYKKYYGRSGLKVQSFSFYLRYLRFKSQFFKKIGFGSVIGYFLEDSIGSTYGKLGIDQQIKILDIGSADGFLPYMLHEVGYKNVVGIDPYIDSPINYKNLARV